MTQTLTVNTDPPLEVPPPATNNSKPIISAIDLKIPPVWFVDPQVWFVQVKAQFSTQSIASEQTKFNYIVVSLSPKYAQEVCDLILSSPTTTPNTQLKQQLIDRMVTSEQCRLQQLFHSEDPYRRQKTNPTVEIYAAAPIGEKASASDTTFLWELFLQCLPANVRMVLASTETKVTKSWNKLCPQLPRLLFPLRLNSSDLRLLISVGWLSH